MFIACHLGHAEVHDAHIAIRSHEDVAGFYVAVHQAVAVGVIKRFGALEDHLHYFAHRQQVVWKAKYGERLRTAHILHDHIAVARILASIVDGQDVGMIQLTDQVCFIEEQLAAGSGLLLGDRLVHVVEFDGHVLAEKGIVAQIDTAGGSPTKLPGNDELAKLGRRVHGLSVCCAAGIFTGAGPTSPAWFRPAPR